MYKIERLGGGGKNRSFPPQTLEFFSNNDNPLKLNKSIPKFSNQNLRQLVLGLTS